MSAYSDFINRINREGYGFLAKGMTTPRNSNELSDDLLRLDSTLDHEIETTDGWLDEAIYNRDHVQTIDGEIASMNDEVKEIQHRNGIMQRYVRTARNESDVPRSYARDQQWRAIEWFDYVRPQDYKRHYVDDPKFRSTTFPPIDIPPVYEYKAPAQFILHPLHPRPHVALAMGVDDSNMGKTNYLTRRFDYLLSAGKQTDQIEKEFDRNALAEKQGKLDELAGLRREATFDGEQLLKQVPAVHADFVLAAAEAFAWKTYTGHIAVPEAQKFYDLNKSWYQASQIDDDTVHNGLKAGKTALSVFSAGAPGQKEFLDAEDRTLDLIADAQRFMREAPRIIAYGSPEETRSFLAEIGNKQSDFNLATMEDAKQTLGPFTPFAQALTGADVPAPYRDIAKKLGLGN